MTKNSSKASLHLTGGLNKQGSVTSLFSKATNARSNAEATTLRDRFKDNKKAYFPSLDADNLGIHSPNRSFYDVVGREKMVSKLKIKRENANYSFNKTDRGLAPITQRSKNNKSMIPGVGTYYPEKSQEKLRETKGNNMNTGFGTNRRLVNIAMCKPLGVGKGSVYDGRIFKDFLN